MSKGFTLIELIVVITIIAILSGIILYSVTQYINKGKDSNISGNLAVLVPAGEVYYNGFPNAYGNESSDFCGSSAVTNAIYKMPDQTSTAPCYNRAITATANPKGVCCKVDPVDHQAWAACAREFANPLMAYCVDSRGVRKEIDSTNCTADLIQCTP